MNYSIGSSGFLFTSMICYWTGLMVVVGTEEGVKEVEKPQKLVQSSYVYSSTLHQKHISNFRCTDFTKDDTRGWDFLTTRMNKHDESRPTYAKGGTWLSFFGHSITLYVRAVRTILNHAPIGEYRARFRPKSHPRARAVNQTLRPELRVSQVHRKPNDTSLPVLRRPR